MIRDQAKEYYEGIIAMQEKEELWKTERSLLIRDLTDALKIIDQLKAEQMRLEEKKDEEIKRLKAQLQEKREEEIEVQFSSEEFPPLGNPHIARPFMEAKVHYSGNTTTAPKVRKISNQLYNVKVEFEIPNCPMFGTTAIIDTWASACCINKKVIPEEALEPLTETLDIIHPDITIEDRPLKHVTPAMEDSFKRHVDSVLKISAIRPSKSRHRTMAMIVNSGTTIDLATGREIKGKERMVFNYKSLNDNTYKDQYSLPGINTIIKKIGGAKIFSKFDLKSGFHQVAMDEESIPRIAFLVPGGLYGWLVMPFGLKNALAVFQRKMDKCFKGTESFIAVYIDDILVFSNNEKEHAKHLEKMLKICEDNGLVLSPTKMKIAVSTIDFFGAVIGEGTIKLQPYIIKKIVNFNEEELKTKKGLRSTIQTCQLKANQTSIRMDKSNAWRSVAQDIEVSTAKEAVKAMQSLQAIIQCKAKYVSECQPKTITGLTKEKTLEFKTKKPEESSLNWKPLPNDWAATTSKPKEVQTNNPEDNMYRYNRKGFLEDDDSSDDSFFIMDPGLDDYCLQELKMNRLIPLSFCQYVRSSFGDGLRKSLSHLSILTDSIILILVLSSLAEVRLRVTCENEAKRRNSEAKTKTFEEYHFLLLYAVSSNEDTAQETRNDQFPIRRITLHQYAVCTAVHQSKIRI
uniref:Retrotransposon protein, putative, Ty3-gypsy subclass n=1 Tax=Tanacetum cinerariifolium TaxID=118510 RepID=A0A6L2NJG5_TANCI|nr:retrotransposon protein, putative, Ty3-gypsy subclass [Tanacetum cinerariifolium]